MELIPCIQTLAHLKSIIRWPAYKPHVDAEDILLVGDDRVYELIESMFVVLARCFTSRVVNIGMDEAYMLGRGKYHDINGENDCFSVLLQHLTKVAEIGKKHGFTLAMWSDMFFGRIAGGDYNVDNKRMYDLIRNQIPDNVQLIYWEYRAKNPKHYDKVLAGDAQLKGGTWFAGGLYIWAGFAPHNGFSMTTTAAAFESCIKQGVQDVLLTLWSNDGGECSRFAVLPSLFYAAELSRSNRDMEKIRQKFYQKYGVSFDDFMLLDLPGTDGASEQIICNPEKYLFYNDCFTGLMDSTISGGENKLYAVCSEKLQKLSDHPTWGRIFACEHALCEVLSIKAELSIRTHQVYRNRNRQELSALIQDYHVLYEKVQLFYKAFLMKCICDVCDGF